MDSQPGSSALWDAADRVLFSWLDLPAEQIEQRVGALAQRDPGMAEALRSRLGQLRRLGLVGAGAPVPTPAVGSRFGAYEIDRLLGAGGMGSVYLATQQSPRRQVALKVIRSDRLGDAGTRERFQREARAVAALRDPGICTVFEVGEVAGTPFLAMQYIEGETLAERLAAQRAQARSGPTSSSGPRTAADIGGVLRLIEKVARSLHTAHEAGVVHRDVKPGNLMIDAKGEPVVLDFGLAHVDAADGEPTLTRTGDVLGTPAYMSPEQLRPTKRAVDRRTDVYSLAATLFECMTLSRPFTGTSEVELYESILRDPTPDPRRHNPHLPIDVGAVIGKAMEKEAARRYATAAEFADDLARLQRHEPVRARRVGVLGRGARWAQRHPVGAALIVVLAVSALATSTLLHASLQQQAVISTTVADLTQRTDEFETLASVVIHEGVLEKEKALYPPWPDKIAAMEAWLALDVAELLARRPDIERVLTRLRTIARSAPSAPPTDPSQHPRFMEWRALQEQVKALALAQAVRQGKETLDLPTLLPAEARGPAIALATAGWPGVAPDRTTFGREALGLAFAQAAAAKLERGDVTLARPIALNTLAWALVANGQDAEARARSDEAVEAASEAERPYWQQRRSDLETTLRGADAELARLQQRLTALTDEVQRTYRFERQSTQYLHDRLVELLPQLATLEIREKARVQRRLEWARRIGPASADHPRAKHSWAEAAEAIAKADDIVASKLYRNPPIRDLVPQMGLVPLGMNPKTKLWEFYDLRSAYAGFGDPSTIPIPSGRFASRADRHRDRVRTRARWNVHDGGATERPGGREPRPQGERDRGAAPPSHVGTVLLGAPRADPGPVAPLVGWRGPEPVPLRAVLRRGAGDAGQPSRGRRLERLHAVAGASWHVPADRSAVGVRLPGGHHDAVVLRLRETGGPCQPRRRNCGQAGHRRRRGVERRPSDPRAGRELHGQRLRHVRHAWQRRRVVP